MPYIECGFRRDQVATEFRDGELDRLNLQVEQLTKQMALETANRKQALELELADLRAEDERLKLGNSIASQTIEAKMIEIRLKEAEFKIEKAGLENEVARWHKRFVASLDGGYDHAARQSCLAKAFADPLAARSDHDFLQLARDAMEQPHVDNAFAVDTSEDFPD